MLILSPDKVLRVDNGDSVNKDRVSLRQSLNALLDSVTKVPAKWFAKFNLQALPHATVGNEILLCQDLGNDRE